MPRNVSRSLVKSERQMVFLEKGIFSIIEDLGKDLADSGAVVLMAVVSSSLPASGPLRMPLIVTGTCYSPKVFEVVPYRFEHSDSERSPELELPCNVEMVVRPCRVGRKCIAKQLGEL